MRLVDLKIGDPVDLPSPVRSAPIGAAVPRRWHVAIVDPGRERSTVDRLEELAVGLGPYLPLEYKDIPAGRRRRREIAVAMFAGYIFVPMPPIDEIWRAVLGTRGIKGLLADVDRRPMQLSQVEVDRIRHSERERGAKRLQRLAAAGQHPIEIGASVWIPDLLPFQALLAVIERYDARGRAEVVLQQQEVLGRKHFAIEPHRLRPID